jgi:Papain fold toxin 2
MQKKSLVSLFIATCFSFSLAIPILEIKVPWLGNSAAVAQVTSTAFKNDASAATSQYNNVNLVCAEYARTLYNFVKANAAKYKIVSYKIYKLEAPGPIAHSDYKNGGASISANGIHYYLVIDDYGFDNHHPTGKVMSSFISGFAVTGKPLLTEITIADLKSLQC